MSRIVHIKRICRVELWGILALSQGRAQERVRYILPCMHSNKAARQLLVQ